MSVTETSKIDSTRIIVYASTIVGSVIGAIGIWLYIAFFTGGSFPFVTGERSAFIAAAIIGFTMCSSVFAIRASLSKKFNWLSPFTIIAIVLGSGITILVILQLTGNLPLKDYVAMIILGALVLLKWVLASISLIVQKL